LAAAWRLADTKRSGLILLFDASRACAFAGVEDLEATAREWFHKDHRHVFDIHEWAEAHVPTIGSGFCLHPREGGRMGNCLAPPMFCVDYCKWVPSWSTANVSRPDGYRMVCEDLITQTPTDLSPTVFVDDVAKLVVRDVMDHGSSWGSRKRLRRNLKVFWARATTS
jgi:hypothetical protein